MELKMSEKNSKKHYKNLTLKTVTELGQLAGQCKNMISELQHAMDKGLYKSCLSCTHFDEPSENCKLYKARPPARVIVTACAEYCHPLDIPF
jgi:uncharacterized cysteine cluster protein YcgN (CxxCxxCC family)